jgi:hypothetical protein
LTLADIVDLLKSVGLLVLQTIPIEVMGEAFIAGIGVGTWCHKKRLVWQNRESSYAVGPNLMMICHHLSIG